MKAWSKVDHHGTEQRKQRFQKQRRRQRLHEHIGDSASERSDLVSGA